MTHNITILNGLPVIVEVTGFSVSEDCYSYKLFNAKGHELGKWVYDRIDRVKGEENRIQDKIHSLETAFKYAEGDYYDNWKSENR